jgi:competence protein ComEC
MRRPLAVIGFTYIFTLIAASFLSFAANCALSVFFVVCAFVTLFALPFFSGRRIAALILFTAAAALLMFSLATYFWYEPAASLDGQTAIVKGTITDLPQLSSGKYYYTIQTTSIKSNFGSGANTKIRAAFDKPLTARPYDSIIFSAKLYIPADTGSGYSSKGYYRSKGIYLFAKPAGDAVITHNKNPPVFYYAIVLREQLLSSIYSTVSGTEGALAAGILIGDTSKLPDKVKSDFQATGISHILAVSGTQTSLIAIYLLLLLTFFKVPRKMSCIISMSAVFLFMAVTAFSPSVTRAGIMSILFLGAMLVNREADALNSLGVSVLLLCLVNPFAATDTGLLLSFSATLGMITISGKLNLFAHKSVKNLPATAQKIILKPAALLSETTGASLLTFPVIILTFGQVSVVALLTNMVEVPLALVSTLTTALIVVLQPLRFLFFIVVPLGFITKICCAFMIWFAGLLAALPFASVSASYGFVNIFLLFVLCTCIAFLLFRKKGANIAVCIVCCCFALSVGIFSYTLSINGVMEIAALPVGDGNCTVIIKDGKAVVIDLSGFSPETQVQSLLKQRNIKSIDALVLASYSTKSIDSANNLISKLTCKQILCPQAYKASQNSFLQIVNESAQINVWNDVQIAVVPDSNGNLTATVTYKNSSAFILSSKTTKFGSLTAQAGLLFYNSAVTSTQAKQLKPKYAIADGSSTALYSSANLETAGSKVLKTDDSGIISVLTRGDGMYMIKTSKQVS